MCKAFSCIVMRSGKVYWQAGIDSHDQLIDKFKVRDDTVDMEEISHAKIEIITNQKNNYPYLYPDDEWTLQIDERVTPSWLLQMHRDKAWEAWREWKEIVYQFNYQEAINPVNPLKIRKHKPSKQDILNLQKWASVRALVGGSVWASVMGSVMYSVGYSVGASVGYSVGASLWDSVGASLWDSLGDSLWDSLGAYVGSIFPNIKKWEYVKQAEGEYPYQPAVDLWKRGLIASFDGKVWMIHSGKDASVVFKITREELKKVK